MGGRVGGSESGLRRCFESEKKEEKHKLSKLTVFCARRHVVLTQILGICWKKQEGATKANIMAPLIVQFVRTEIQSVFVEKNSHISGIEEGAFDPCKYSMIARNVRIKTNSALCTHPGSITANE